MGLPPSPKRFSDRFLEATTLIEITGLNEATAW